MRSFIQRTGALALLIGISAAVATAQAAPESAISSRRPLEPETYGIEDAVSHTVQAFSFQAFDVRWTDVLGANSAGSRFCTQGCFLEAPLLLPSGALITLVELDACDFSTASNLQFVLFRTGAHEASVQQLATAITAGAPGCIFLSAFVTPHTVDNRNNSYWIEVSMGGTGGEARFQAVRVFYKLQVSPAPATATFLDVPTSSPIFRFVEALSAAGITGGCGGGNFCPNAPLTRGQMAVFLSVALGLHFAP